MFPFLFPSLSLSLLFLKTMFSSLLLLINGLTIPQGPTVFSKGEFIETNIFYEGRRWLNPFFSLFFFRPRSRSCHSSWDSEIHRDEGTRKYRRVSSVLWNLSIQYSVLKVLGIKRIHNITTHITPVTLIALVTCCDLFLRTHLSVLEFTSCIFAGNHQPVIETIRVSERLVVVVSKSYLLWTRWEWEIRWFVLWSIFKRKLHRPVKFTTHHHPPPPPLATETA